jgi:hypothetical protein
MQIHCLTNKRTVMGSEGRLEIKKPAGQASFLWNTKPIRQI